jgi:predicted TIM-barrel fold metal-dependent hydrolase
MIIDVQNVIHPAVQTPDELLVSMDQANIDRAVVYSVRGDFFDNDYTAEAVKQHSDRFIGLAYINPRREGAKFELRRVRDLGLAGIELNPKHDDYPLGIGSHWFMDDILSFCVEHDLVVMADGWGDSPHTMPYQFRDVAWSFPELTLILAHMGMMGGYGDVQRVGRLCENVYLNTATTTSSQVWQAVEMAGADKVLMGTNTPTECFEVETKKVEVAVPDPEARSLVLGENARKLFRI